VDSDLSPLGTQISYSATVVYLLQLAKNNPRLAFINNNSATVNRIIAVLASGAAAMGAHWTLTGTLIEGEKIVITIPPLADVLTSLAHWFQSFVMQETIYRAVAQKASTPTPDAPVEQKQVAAA